MRPLVLLLSGLLIVCSGCLKAPPPQFHGQPVAYWSKLVHSKDSKRRREAMDALSEMGHAGVPGLVQLLDDKDPDIRKRAAKELIEMQVGADEVAEWARNSEDARKILKSLCLEEKYDGYFIALAQSGEEALPIFREFLESDDRSIAWTAAMALEEMRPLEAAIPLLQQAFHSNPHREVRERAQESLRICCQTD